MKKLVVLGAGESGIGAALLANKHGWDVFVSDNNKISNYNDLRLNNIDWEEIIYISVQLKNKIVINDPKEKGERRKVNVGHTFGHAIESYYLKKRTPILHGEAIFIGMMLESEISVISYSEKNEIKNYILSNFELPYTPSMSKIRDFLKNDKKNRKNKINFSLLKGIGHCTINNLFEENEL